MNGNYGDERLDISGYDDEKRGDISVDYGINVFRSQETGHSYYRNLGYSVDGYCRGEYRSHTIQSSSNNTSDHGRLLHLSVASRMYS